LAFADIKSHLVQLVKEGLAQFALVVILQFRYYQLLGLFRKADSFWLLCLVFVVFIAAAWALIVVAFLLVLLGVVASLWLLLVLLVVVLLVAAPVLARLPIVLLLVLLASAVVLVLWGTAVILLLGWATLLVELLAVVGLRATSKLQLLSGFSLVSLLTLLDDHLCGGL
jgi:hypothetical protein